MFVRVSILKNEDDFVKLLKGPFRLTRESCSGFANPTAAGPRLSTQTIGAVDVSVRTLDQLARFRSVLL